MDEPATRGRELATIVEVITERGASSGRHRAHCRREVVGTDAGRIRVLPAFKWNFIPALLERGGPAVAVNQ